MRKFVLLSIAVYMLMACRQNPDPSSQDNPKQIRKDKIDPALKTGNVNDFASKAAIGSMMEIESSALMIKHTENPDVQSLATMMVKDHTMAQKDLKAIAVQEGLMLPQTLPATKQIILSRLDSLKEDECNYYYAALMVSENEEAVKLFRNAIKQESNAKLNGFAKSKLPTLEHHLLEAKNVLKTLKSINKDKGNLPLQTSKDQSTAQ